MGPEHVSDLSPELADVAAVFNRSRVTAEIFDPEWRLLWVSEELKKLLGEEDERALGCGCHVLEARNNELWRRTTTAASRVEWSRVNLPFILYETPQELLEEAIARLSPEDLGQAQGVEPEPAPALWTYVLEYRRRGFAPMRISCIGARLNDADGARVGSINVYTPALPSSVLDLLARGDERMFERMSRLIEPGRRAAAILFADLEASGALSRRLPSATYFRLIRELTTAVDAVVGEHEGIVGKHAGDGVTALFLADELGSPSRAARAAVAAAGGIARACAEIGARFAAEAPGLDPEEVHMNVGLHWGGALYVGQIVTGGRLEITALGDEVNECARIQQSARGGTAYATKLLLEQLEPVDATAAGVDPDAVAYRTVAELPGADEKSVRDAGGLAVARLPDGA
jgi:class 3 adenylate cyclase